MEGRQKKVQVVLAALGPDGGWSLLLFKTNQKRGHFWQNVTGSVEGNETYEEAALREAQEESALAIESIVELTELGLVHNFLDKKKRKVEEHCFLIVTDGQWTPTIDPHEHEQWRWIKASEAKEGCVEWPSNFEAIQKALGLLRRMGA